MIIPYYSTAMADQSPVRQMGARVSLAQSRSETAYGYGAHITTIKGHSQECYLSRETEKATVKVTVWKVTKQVDVPIDIETSVGIGK